MMFVSLCGVGKVRAARGRGYGGSAGRGGGNRQGEVLR